MGMLWSILVNYALACGVHAPNILQQMYDEKQFPSDQIIYSSSNPNHRGWRQFLTKSLEGTRTLALTFDDGPHPVNTPKLLDILDRHGVKATFFVVAELAAKYPQIAAEIVKRGHVLASHDWRHDDSNSETESVYKNGLKQSLLVVKKFYQKRESYYRFPYGAYARGNGGYHHFNVMKDLSQELFGENCINFAFWDIDTSDWVQDMTTDNIVETLQSNLRGGRAWRFVQSGRNYSKQAYQIINPVDGGVVLMHDIHAKTGLAVDKFLSSPEARDVKFVTLPQIEEFAYGALRCELLSFRR